MEMNAVADKFDHGDGMIDWREFIAALRPDWEDRGPLTDTERIDDEINRQVAQCTCRQKFKVFQVGEGKYRVSCEEGERAKSSLLHDVFSLSTSVRRVPEASPRPYPEVDRDGASRRRLGRLG